MLYKMKCDNCKDPLWHQITTVCGSCSSKNNENNSWADDNGVDCSDEVIVENFVRCDIDTTERKISLLKDIKNGTGIPQGLDATSPVIIFNADQFYLLEEIIQEYRRSLKSMLECNL